jgi:hypothetical protein
MKAKRKQSRPKAPTKSVAKGKKVTPGPTKGAAKAAKAEAAFVRGLVARGEAAKVVDGQLPPGATHEIVEQKEGCLPSVKRRRFYLA